MCSVEGVGGGIWAAKVRAARLVPDQRYLHCHLAYAHVMTTSGVCVAGVASAPPLWCRRAAWDAAYAAGRGTVRELSPRSPTFDPALVLTTSTF